MRIGSLFSGAGGLDMAVEQVFGATTAWHCEVDPAASKVLAHRWPDVSNLGDITKIDWTAVEPVDILCGGFPCQDVSSAGRRAGIKTGTRSGLWCYFTDAIAALHPRIVVVENVRGLLSARAHRDMERNDPIMGNNADGFVLRAAGAVLGDLADLGYDAQWATVAASDVGAPHRRERVFVIATDTQLAGSRRETDDARWRKPDTGRCALRIQPERRCTAGDGPCRVHSIRRCTICGPTRPVELLPTPSTHDRTGSRAPESLQRMEKPFSNLNDTVVNELLPTPSASDGDPNGGPNAPENRLAQGHHVQLIDLGIRPNLWGKYEPAIRRWEALTRTAPSPTEPNTKGNPRLAAAFSEWLMGWPAGWVTAVPGISRNDQLRIIGNGVCPQQAVAALRWLLSISEAVA